nr:DUF3795 domain-containing protein [Candidatus Sigynarchaeota archaeon]
MVSEDQNLVAPCGINCGICTSYLAHSRDIPLQKGVSHCTGCRIRNKNCAFIKKNCEFKVGKEIAYCHECPTFPCERLKAIDDRYRRDYNTSLIENLTFIKEHGVDVFTKKQREQYKCAKCGGMICVHNGFCYDCGKAELDAYVKAKKSTVRKLKNRK